MNRFRVHLIALGIVTLWSAFSYAYLGIEDGSSGLSPPGWISAVFFFPGTCLFQNMAGSHSNADLPLIAAIGWVTYSVIGITIIQVISTIRRSPPEAP